MMATQTIQKPEAFKRGNSGNATPSASQPNSELTEGYLALGYQEGTNIIWSSQRRCVVHLDSNAINSVVLETHGGTRWLFDTYGEKTPEGGKKINLPKARSELIAACAAAGRYNSAQAKGAGVWLIDIDGKPTLVANSGDSVFDQQGNNIQRASKSAVFAEGRCIGITPAGATISQTEVKELTELLQTWNWANKSDAAMLLGWIALSTFSGVIDRRPIFAVQSQPQCGKTTLTELIGNLLGTGRLNFIGAQTTTAGITDQLQSDSLPVLLDEIFAAKDASPRDRDRVASLQVLLRTAFGSGSDGIAKGTADGRGVIYTTRFSAFIASRSFPAMDDQDRSRMAHCRLLPRTSETRKHPLMARPDLTSAIGNRMRNYLFQNWAAFEETAGNVREVFICDHGLSDRMFETLGQLIAAWHVLTEGTPANLEQAKDLVAKFDLSTHVERINGHSDERDCADWLMGYRPTSSAHSIGELLRRAKDGHKDCMAVLEDCGIKIYDGYAQVCASNSIKGLREVFEGSNFGNAGWASMLAHVPGAKSTNPRFCGKTMRAVAVPLTWLFDEIPASQPEQGKLDLPRRMKYRALRKIGF